MADWSNADGQARDHDGEVYHAIEGSQKRSTEHYHRDPSVCRLKSAAQAIADSPSNNEQCLIVKD